MPASIYEQGATGGSYRTGRQIKPIDVSPQYEYLGPQYTPYTTPQGHQSFKVDYAYRDNTPQNIMKQVLNQYTTAHNQGVGANEQRFEDMLGGYRDRYGRTMSGLEGLGQAEAQRINQQFDRLGAQTQQSAVGRGLYNTTVTDSLMRGVEDQRAQAHAELQEQLRRENLGYHSQQSKDTLDFMERRTDSYPSLEMLAQLSQQLGEADRGIFTMEGQNPMQQSQPQQPQPQEQPTGGGGGYPAGGGYLSGVPGSFSGGGLFGGGGGGVQHSSGGGSSSSSGGGGFPSGGGGGGSIGGGGGGGGSFGGGGGFSGFASGASQAIRSGSSSLTSAAQGVASGIIDLVEQGAEDSQIAESIIDMATDGSGNLTEESKSAISEAMSSLYDNLDPNAVGAALEATAGNPAGALLNLLGAGIDAAGDQGSTGSSGSGTTQHKFGYETLGGKRYKVTYDQDGEITSYQLA